MSRSRSYSRRDFLKLSGTASLGVALSACGISNPPTLLPVGTNELSPTGTPSPATTQTFTPTHFPTDTPTPSATPTATSTVAPTSTPTPKSPETLREYADALGIEFGGDTAIAYFQDWQPEHTKMVPFFLQNFNLFANVWDAGWTNANNPLRPSKTDFDFSMMDKYVDFAQAKYLRSQAQALAWGNKSGLPGWLLNGDFSETELLGILENHIHTVVGRYKGKINEWCVVNELLGLPWEPGQRFWYDHLDKQLDWVRKSFQWANEADPSAALYLNDFGIEFPGNYLYQSSRDAFDYDLIRNLKDSGIAIHAVGFQMHLYASKNFVPATNIPSLMDGLYKSIQKYLGLGIDVYVTEYDFVLSGLTGTTEGKFALQAEATGSILDTCLTAGVKNFTIFNLIDRLSWLETPENPPYSGKDADPCPWDGDYQPKPAYFAMLDVMKKHYSQRAH
jgi:endo-1,4-beta-xylanase